MIDGTQMQLIQVPAEAYMVESLCKSSVSLASIVLTLK